MSRPPAYDEAYPRALWEYERARLLARVPGRALTDDRPAASVVGVALSGGGIRSATFCLGLFQALARLRRLAAVDYLSTVSGGGYFGAFLGRLYARREITSAEQVRSLLDPTAAPEERPTAVPDVVGWLRENGRYLSPNGAGDLLLAGAILVRNWVTMHVVVLSFALLLLVTGQLPRIVLEMLAAGHAAGEWLGVACAPRACGPSWLWWSPWIVVPGLTLLFWAVPLAWAFWMTGRWRHRPWIERPVTGLVAAIVVAAGFAVGVIPIPGLEPARTQLVGVGVLVAAGLTIAAWAFALLRSRRDPDVGPGDFPSPDSRRVYEIDLQRNLLSSGLKVALVATAALLAYALIDSLGQTLYLVAMQPGRRLFSYVGSGLAALGGAAAFAQRIATALSGRSGGGGSRLRLPLAMVVTAGALAVATLVLVSLSALTHGLAWSFREPAGGPVIAWATVPASRATINVQIPESGGGAVTATAVVSTPGKETVREECRGAVGACPRTAAELRSTGIVWVIALVFGIAFGRCWPFINQSSLQSMYSARLTRAFLGASNPRRRKLGREHITHVEPGDNIDPADYWPAPSPDGDPTARPLHIVNVTINETMDSKSNVQQQDRKGTGLAIGPCAFSAGVRHHAVFASHDVFRSGDVPRPATASVFPAPGADARTPVYRVFEDAAGGRWPGGERLSMGAWAGISGAAFSTGLGARTSLGLSLLCGLGNVRLGYWWNSGVDPARRHETVRRPWLVERAFQVQAYFLSEFLSRFHGTSRRHWYLSDGGHFENMGAYELIRRRLGRILLVDAEADPDYTFEGLANLVRKARLDFGAEIEFLTAHQLDAEVPPSHRRLFGTLEQLRRGKWAEEPVEERYTAEPRRTIEEPVDESRHSLAHAALARVTFADDPGWEGWLLYLKPTLMGDEPADLVQYHRTHSAFPQETTADQFFDEAQWESYRMLGYHIGSGVFGGGLAAPVPAAGAVAPPSPAERLFGA